MKRLLGILMSLMLLILCVLPAGASDVDINDLSADLNLTFSTNSRFTRNGTLASDGTCVIKAGTEVTLEAGYTWVIYGDLEIYGIFTNRGTLKIVKSSKEEAEPAVCNNKGDIINEGTILIENSKVRNFAGSKIVNSGTIKIVGDEKISFLWNMESTMADGNRPSGLVENTGTIWIANTKGIGFHNSGKVINNGTIKADEGASFRGIKLRDPKTEVPQPTQPSAPGQAAPTQPQQPVTPGQSAPKTDGKAVDRFVKGGKKS